MKMAGKKRGLIRKMSFIGYSTTRKGKCLPISGCLKKQYLIGCHPDILIQMFSSRDTKWMPLKGRLAIDIEWNAKDGNLDRDLSAYRAWYELSVIDAAILITKEQESCQRLVNDIWARYTGENPEMKGKKPPVDLKTSTTTNLEKAVERIKRGDAGGCPVLIVAITDKTWDQTPYSVLTE